MVTKTQQRIVFTTVNHLRYHSFNCEICPILNVVGHFTRLKLRHSPLLNLGQNEDWTVLAITDVFVPHSPLPPAPQNVSGVPMLLPPLLRADQADRKYIRKQLFVGGEMLNVMSFQSVVSAH